MSTFIMDIDSTICFSDFDSEKDKYDYENGKPEFQVSEKIRKLHKEGNSIILFTARGMRTFKGDVKSLEEYHRPILETWLEKYNIPYDQLIFGKPWFKDVFYVDDRGLTINQFINSENYNEELIQNQSLENSLVSVSEKHYERLTDDSHFLNCLEAMGVDNWPGYEEAEKMRDGK